MADPASYRPAPGEIPTAPGVYRFFDPEGRVIYVGKAKNLRNRLSNYFQDTRALHPRTQKMVTTANRVEWTVVTSELEALTLEYQWIKEYAPRFNVVFRDDKSYPYLAVTLDEEIPRVQIMRGARRKGVRYFGPYAQVWAIRETMELLGRVFPVRTCSKAVLKQAQDTGRECLLGHIDRCCAPCVGKVSIAEHRAMAERLCDFLDGKVGNFIKDLREKMLTASAAQEYERAAKIRDDIAALEKVLEQNTVVLADTDDVDLLALKCDELEALVQVFHVRGGRIRGKRSWVSSHAGEVNTEELMQLAIEQVYTTYAANVAGASSGKRDLQVSAPSRRRSAPRSVDDVAHLAAATIPPEILVSHLPANAEMLQQWLEGLRHSRVRIRQPQRGAKKHLMETVMRNAEESIRQHKLHRSSDIFERERTLEALGEALGLPSAPLRIECYDISHTMGTYQMGSMVVFEDAMPRKDAYRIFEIKGRSGLRKANDPAALSQVLARRLARLTAEQEVREGKRFSYRPDLIIVDGGQGQVNAARETVTAAGYPDIPVVGLAKRLEEVWFPQNPTPLLLPRDSHALYLIQYLRDESHRFAITAHRRKRSRAMTKSVLDQIPGLGAKRQQALLDYFKTPAALEAAGADEISQVPGIGEVLAGQVADFFAARRAESKE